MDVIIKGSRGTCFQNVFGKNGILDFVNVDFREWSRAWLIAAKERKEVKFGFIFE